MYALITGASKGIGKAIAIELASQGYNILLVARNENELKGVCREIVNRTKVKAAFLPLDLSLASAPKKVEEWIRSLDADLHILVNNAGYGLSGRFENQNLNDIQNMMQLNMLTLVSLTHLLLPKLKQHSKSYILNVASISAYQSTPNLAVYAASKTFVVSFSRALNHELKNSGVSVTCVSPGPTNTAFVERANLTEKGLERMKKVHMQPHEVAQTAVRSLLNNRAEVVPGFTNKMASFMAWLFPKSLVERIAGRIIGNVVK